MRTLAVLMIALAVGIGGAWFLTNLSWRTRIEGRAFTCGDDTGFGNFHTHVAIHASAGDLLSEGWTWEKVRQEQKGHWVLFAASALTLSWLTCRTLRPRRERPEIQ